MQHGRVTHMEEYETKYNELVQQGSKSHGTSITVSSSSYNELHMPTLVLTTLGDNIILNQVKTKIRYIHKTFKKLHAKGGTHQKSSQLIKATVSSKIIIGGLLKLIHAISYMQT